MSAPTVSPGSVKVPPLRQGDHLDREEFERRYDAMPELKKAELIDGVVHMPSPVRHEEHGIPHSDLITWLGVYRFHTPGVLPGTDSSVRLDLGGAPQPDALLMIDPNRGGQAAHDADRYITGGPELVAEVSASTVSMDLNSKLLLYQRNGVREYIVWRVEESAIDWFVLRDGQYVLLLPGTDGIIRSEVFPGLWLDPQTLITLNPTRLLAVLQQGLASQAHADFVAHLQQARTP
jgi:Uma2 family endonuclease